MRLATTLLCLLSIAMNTALAASGWQVQCIEKATGEICGIVFSQTKSDLDQDEKCCPENPEDQTASNDPDSEHCIDITLDNEPNDGTPPSIDRIVAKANVATVPFSIVSGIPSFDALAQKCLPARALPCRAPTPQLVKRTIQLLV